MIIYQTIFTDGFGVEGERIDETLSKVQAQIMSSGEITVHMKTMQVYKGDEPVTLSKKEFSLLLYLWGMQDRLFQKKVSWSMYGI